MACRGVIMNHQFFELSEQSFKQMRQWLYDQSGIYLSPEKQILVRARLHNRLLELKLQSFEQYLPLLRLQHQEQQQALNLLTTNETYFFREPAHFDFLRERLTQPPLKNKQSLRFWSAASSSGEEAYSLALLLADVLGLEANWRILGTDISSEVLNTARRAVYPLQRAERIPTALLQKFCLKGKDKNAGSFSFVPALRQHLEFRQLNLMSLPDLQQKFDVIFLRNVLIYFKKADWSPLIHRLVQYLEPGGLLLVGHAESITNIHPELQLLAQSCYQYSPQDETN